MPNDAATYLVAVGPHKETTADNLWKDDALRSHSLSHDGDEDVAAHAAAVWARSGAALEVDGAAGVAPAFAQPLLLLLAHPSEAVRMTAASALAAAAARWSALRYDVATDGAWDALECVCSTVEFVGAP